MSLSSLFGFRNSFWVEPSPMELMMMLFDNAPASSFARDVRVIAITSVDWKETATEHVFKADLPGLRKEDVQVQVEDERTLIISGQRRREGEPKTDIWHLLERSSGQFMRRFRLPENANLDGITAKVESGVLTVVVPKVEKTTAQWRSVAIEAPGAIAHDEKSAVEAAAGDSDLAAEQ